jgi:hypothetical protein
MHQKPVDCINVFQVCPNMFRQMVAIVVGALEATQALSVLWVYADYDPSRVASCRVTTTGF